MKETPSTPKQFTLVVTIQAIFLAICLILAGTLTGYNFIKSRESTLEAGKELLDELSKNVVQEIKILGQRPTQLVENLPNIPAISQKPAGLDHPLLDYFNNALDNNSDLNSIYLGWDDGDFYYVSRVRNNGDFRIKMKAPKNTERIIYSITVKDGERMRTTGYYALDGNPTGPPQTTLADFDPRERTWYKEGKLHPGKPYRTEAYLFATQQVLGTTFTNTFWGKTGGVIGVDIVLGSLAQFLANQTPGPDGRIMVFTEQGQAFFKSKKEPTQSSADTSNMANDFTIAEMSSINDPVMAKMYEVYKKDKPVFGEPFTFREGKMTYMANIMQSSFSTKGLLVAIITTEQYFTEEIRKIGRNSLLFSAVLICIAILLIVMVSRRISESLKTLARKTDEIRRFNLDTEIDVHSRIREVAKLAESVRDMKTGIQTFTQYIPKDLVRRYVSSNTTPEIGGDRRTLTLLFTDIAGFTTMSENMIPEAIITMLSDYFSRMGTVVSAHNGTIDKYIGDALMAFWNAPELSDAHTLEGCRAALHCAKVVHDYEYIDENGSIAKLSTRFGLHRGEAVVGNMGSADRLNYTALGSTVNMASRLEGLNKYYGTTILASEEVKLNAADHFVFRSVDKVLPKGALTPITIYELVGSCMGSSIPEVEVSAATTDHLKEWEKAYALFQAQQWDEALALFEGMERTNDTLVAMYIERSRKYKHQGPGQDWDGVEVMKAK